VKIRLAVLKLLHAERDRRTDKQDSGKLIDEFFTLLVIYVFICGLFNDADSNSGYMASIDRMIKNELERTKQEAARYLPGGAEENHENLSG
jgi:hypothetical protein